MARYRFLKSLLNSAAVLLLCANAAMATVYECQQEHNYLWWPDSPKDLKDNWKYSDISFDDEAGILDIGVNRVAFLSVKQKINLDGETVASSEGKTGNRLGETLFIIRRSRHQNTLHFLFISADDGATGTCRVNTKIKTLKAK